MDQDEFNIREIREPGGVLRVAVNGELDLHTGPALADRLRNLSGDPLLVRLDLSKVDFIDSTGIQVLIRAVEEAREESWDFRVDPSLTPHVRRALTIVRADRFVLGEDD